MGKANDTVSWADDKIAVSSVFTPSGTARFFGAPSVRRSWSYAPSNGTHREEITLRRSITESVRWTIQNHRLVRTDGLGKSEEFPSVAIAHRYLDSTIFPYAALTNLPLQDNEWIINSNAPYQAKIRKTSTTLVYDAKGREGTVQLRNRIPVRLEMQTEAGTVVATQSGERCTTSN